MATAAELAGTVVWHDLMTPDKAKALAFYEALFGWSGEEMEMAAGFHYTLLRSGGREIGGMVGYDPGAPMPPHWMGYIGVEDVDGSAARAGELGGEGCVPPTEIPKTGRFAVITDPTGAAFSLWQGVPEMEQQVCAEASEHGFGWDELASSDVELAMAFYGELFGWRFEVFDVESPEPYWLAMCGERPVAGLAGKPAAAPRSAWSTYVSVADAAGAVQQATAAGGEVLLAPTFMDGVGTYAVLADPTGAAIGVAERVSRASSKVGAVSKTWRSRWAAVRAGWRHRVILFASQSRGRRPPAVFGMGAWLMAAAKRPGAFAWRMPV